MDRDCHQRDAQELLRETRDAYVLNVATGLYEPKSEGTVQQVEQQTPGYQGERPFFVSIRPHWTGTAASITAFVGLVISFLTLLLLGATAYYAKKQWKTMDETYQQVKTQNGLLAAQLKGTEAAFIELSPLLNDKEPSFNEFTMIARNTGHAIATEVHINVRISRLSLAGKLLEKPKEYPFFIPAMDYKTGGPEFVQRVIVWDSKHGSEVLTSARSEHEAVKVEIGYSYINGFGDLISGEYPCKEFFGLEWMPCENLPFRVKDLGQ